MQGDLINMMVHDLKGPLMEVISNLDLINGSPDLGEDNREYATTAMEGCQGMYELVQDMLDLGKMEAGMMKLEKAEFDLSAAVKAEVEKMRRTAEDKKAPIELKAPEAVTIIGDEKLLGRVVANLISNGLKYSPPGNPLKVIVQEREGAAIVMVKDQGPGVPAEYRERIFEKYAQVELRTYRRQGSTGLGLPFCKMAVEAHGGKVGLNCPDRGSEFYFVIPKNG